MVISLRHNQEPAANVEETSEEQCRVRALARAAFITAVAFSLLTHATPHSSHYSSTNMADEQPESSQHEAKVHRERRALATKHDLVLVVK